MLLLLLLLCCIFQQWKEVSLFVVVILFFIFDFYHFNIMEMAGVNIYHESGFTLFDIILSVVESEPQKRCVSLCYLKSVCLSTLTQL